jgi:hypothetical protein
LSLYIRLPHNYFVTALILLPLLVGSGCGGNAGDQGPDVPHLSWVAPVEREDGTALSLSEIKAYRVYYGEKTGDYSHVIEIQDNTAVYMVLSSIPAGTYYAAVTAVDTLGRESGFSPEIIISQ